MVFCWSLVNFRCTNQFTFILIRYDEQLREQQNIQKEDLSDMVAEHAARQQKVKCGINALVLYAHVT